MSCLQNLNFICWNATHLNPNQSYGIVVCRNSVFHKAQSLWNNAQSFFPPILLLLASTEGLELEIN